MIFQILDNPSLPRTEIEIRGNKKVYDACSSKSFFKAIFAYKWRVFKIIGSSKTFYIDGIEQNSTKTHYFFVYRKRYLHNRRLANH